MVKICEKHIGICGEDCPWCKLTALRTLLQEAIQEWGSCTRSNDPYTVRRFENFSNRPEVKKVMEE